MSTTNNVAQLYETMFSVPGMNEPVKVQVSLPRKAVFLLAKVIERGFSPKDAETAKGILAAIKDEDLNELKTLPDELLKKAGLTDMNEKLKSLT